MVRSDLSSFDDAYSESPVHVRGTTGSVVADFDHNTVMVNTRSFAGITSKSPSVAFRLARACAGALGTLLATVGQKFSLLTAGDPTRKAWRAVAQFAGDRIRSRTVDPRLASSWRCVVTLGG